MIGVHTTIPPTLLSAAVPVKFAENILENLQAHKLIGQPEDTDATELLRHPKRFMQAYGQEGERRLAALERFDREILTGLNPLEIPTAHQCLIGPTFFHRGETETKLRRYLGMIRQYTLALPLLMEIDNTLEAGSDDQRMQIALTVQFSHQLIADNLTFPATDLLAAGIQEAYSFASGATMQNIVAPVESILYLLQVIGKADLAPEQSAMLFLSLFAVATQLPQAGEYTVIAGLLSMLSEKRLLLPTLIPSRELATYRRYLDRLKIPRTPEKPDKMWQDFERQAAAKIDSLDIWPRLRLIKKSPED